MGSLSTQLVLREIATMKQVEEALARQVLYGGDLLTNILEVLGGKDEAAITYALAEHHGLRPAPTGELPRPPAIVHALVAPDVASRHGFCAIGKEGESLVIAVAEPLAQEVEDELTFATGMPIVQLAAPLPRIKQALARDYKVPIDRRLLRLLSKLEGLPDPSPSSLPPPLASGARAAGFRAPRFPRAFSEEPTTRPGLGTVKEKDEPPSSQSGGVPAPSEGPILRWVNRARAAVAPAGKRRRGPMTLAVAEEAMGSAETPEEALSVFFDFARQFFGYAAMFVVRGDLAEGRDAFGSGASREQVAGIGVPLDLPSCLAHAKNRVAPVCVPLAEEGIDAALAKDLGRAPGITAVVVPVVVRGRAVALLYGDDGDDGLELAQVGDVLAAAPLAGAALSAIAARRKAKARADRTPRGEEMRRAATFAGLPAVSATPAPVNPARERKAEALARALGIPAKPVAPVVALSPAAEGPARRVTASFGAASADASTDAAPPPSTPDVEVREATGDEDELLRAALDDLEPQSSNPPPPEPAHAEDGTPMSRSSYHPPRPPPSPREEPPSGKFLPSVIVEVGDEQIRLVERLIAGEDEQEVLGEVLRQGTPVVPALLARLPGPTRATDEDLASGRVRPSAAGPVFRALVALRRTALPFIVVHSAHVDTAARFHGTLLLGELAYAESAAALLPRLFDPEPGVRRAAATATRALRSAPEIALLVSASLEKILTSPHERTQRRSQAAEALGAIVSTTSVPLLIDALGGTDGRVVATVTESLRRITLQDFDDDRDAWKSWWKKHGTEPRTAWLIEGLLHPSEPLRLRAAAELGSVLPFDLTRFGALSDTAREALVERARAWFRDQGG